MSVRIISDTRLSGLQTLSRRFARDHRRVLVGVPKGPAEADGTSIAMVAAANEFGVPGKIPERSFLRAGILRNLDQLTQINAANIQKIARGGFTVLTALGRLGVFAAGAVQKEIVEGSFVPNAPSTVAKKKSSKPLIDSGSLRQAITWRIANENETEQL